MKLMKTMVLQQDRLIALSLSFLTDPRTINGNQRLIQRVAKKYLTLEKTVILVVGQKSEIMMKLPDHPVTLQELTKGPVKDVPLRDPLTMKPVAQ